VANAPVIRILRLRPAGVGFDGVLRAALPALRVSAGLLDVAAGRHGPDELGPRIVASVWASTDAMEAALESQPGSAALTAPPDAMDALVESLALDVAFRAEPTRMPRVVRAFAGQVRPGTLGAYVDAARAGTLIDDAAGRGPCALYLARLAFDPDRFMTISTWSDWAAIEAATGGDIRRPVATRHPERLVAWEATHFESLQPPE
jgi:quinol monooxygenase YgiN